MFSAKVNTDREKMALHIREIIWGLYKPDQFLILIDKAMSISDNDLKQCAIWFTPARFEEEDGKI